LELTIVIEDVLGIVQQMKKTKRPWNNAIPLLLLLFDKACCMSVSLFVHAPSLQYRLVGLAFQTVEVVNM
jgi:hypothetical protein